MGVFSSLYRWYNTLSCTICAAYPPSIESAAWRNYCGKRIQKRLWDFPPSLLPPPPHNLSLSTEVRLIKIYVAKKQLTMRVCRIVKWVGRGGMCVRCMHKRNILEFTERRKTQSERGWGEGWSQTRLQLKAWASTNLFPFHVHCASILKCRSALLNDCSKNHKQRRVELRIRLI